jgi:hypothetical protein
MEDIEEAISNRYINMANQEAFDTYNSSYENKDEQEFYNLVLLQAKNNVSEVIQNQKC